MTLFFFLLRGSVSFDNTAAAGALQTYLTGIMTTPGNYAVTVTGTQHEITGGASPGAINLGSGVKVSLRGTGTIKKTAGVGSYAWNVGSGGKLILRGVTLDGNSLNREVVTVAFGGELVMENGAITGAVNYGGYAGGVWLNGTFIMRGGSIHGNKCNGNGGGCI